MDQDERERRRAVIERARENCNRLAAVPHWQEETPPHEDVLETWARGMPQPEPVKPERQLDTAPVPLVDWGQHIRQAVSDERVFLFEVLAETIADLHAQAADDLERATRSLTAELADLKATLAEVRLVLAREKGIDLPVLGQLRH